jgi:uncharacterized membrane protein SpoIIM required for sporulation
MATPAEIQETWTRRKAEHVAMMVERDQRNAATPPPWDAREAETARTKLMRSHRPTQAQIEASHKNTDYGILELLGTLALGLFGAPIIMLILGLIVAILSWQAPWMP